MAQEDFRTMNVILTTYQGAILGPVAKVLGYILQALYSLLSNFGIENTGICIILFTFIVNALMLPMQIKQQKFSKMSAIMNPEIQEIQKKYKNKKDQESQQKMSLETQAVYQKYGVSPASGCLPMLITFPILFALYRVIYNIPAYVPQIYDIYSGLAEQIQAAGITVEQLSDMVMAKTYVITDAVRSATESNDLSYYVDVLGQFNESAWKELMKSYPDLESVITNVSNTSKHINSFLGLNIADNPGIKSVSIIIPVLSVITQILSIKISMAGTKDTMNQNNNPTAASMKMMNNVMPIITGLMCFMFPIGVGIYWIAGNIFRIFQSLGINLYFKNMDMDAELEKNIEKAKRRYEKMGVDPNKAMQEIAKKRTSTISTNTTDSKNTKGDISKNVNSVKNSKSNYKTGGNKKYKEGSIASYANMMARDSNDKN